ncbi:MAG: CvfB family protein [Elusimicrobiota bacterium]
MIQIGKYNYLPVVKEVDFGVYLDGESFGEILLPSRYVPKECSVGDILDVFLYKDSEDRIIATTEKPYAEVGEFAFLKVVDVTRVGAFMDWGLAKDLLVPFAEQKEKRMEKGKYYVVRIYLDEKSERIAASAKLSKFLDNEAAGYEKGEEVDLLIYAKTDMGYQAVINNSHTGLVYKTEVFSPLKIGQKTKGFIKKIREDGKIDLCLQKPGYGKIEGIAEKILEKLKEEGGFIPLSDKSNPEIIYRKFGISKKNYKKAVGALFKKRLITISSKGITLKTSQPEDF